MVHSLQLGSPNANHTAITAAVAVAIQRACFCAGSQNVIANPKSKIISMLKEKSDERKENVHF